MEQYATSAAASLKAGLARKTVSHFFVAFAEAALCLGNVMRSVSLILQSLSANIHRPIFRSLTRTDPAEDGMSQGALQEMRLLRVDVQILHLRDSIVDEDMQDGRHNR